MGLEANLVRGRWQKGQSGNPNGRPKTVKVTEELKKLIAEGKTAQELARIWVDKSLAGDIQWFRLMLERTEGLLTQTVEALDGGTAREAAARVFSEVRELADSEAFVDGCGVN